MGRAGMAQRVINLCYEITSTDTSYKEAMILAGKISVIVQAAGCDDCWSEKVNIGINSECAHFETLIEVENKKG